MDEIGLPGEERRRLEDIDDLGDGRDLGNVVDVGEHRNTKLRPSPSQGPEALRPFPAPRKLLSDDAVGLVEARLEDEENAELVGHRFQPFGGSELQFLALDDARAGDEEKGLVEAD